MYHLRQTDTGWELVDTDGTVIATGDSPEAVVASAALVAAVDPPASYHWQGPIVFEGQIETGDGRSADPGAWSWEVPLPLTWQREGGSHDGAVVVGTVWEIERRDGGEIYGRGTFDLGSEEGREAARHVGEGLTNDVSIEPDSMSWEIRVTEEVYAEWQDAFAEDGEDAGEGAEAEPETDDEGRIILARERYDDVMQVVTAGRIRTLAMVTTAAHDEARIDLADGVTLDALLGDAPDAMAAAAEADLTPLQPASWFADPEFGDGPEDDPRLVRDARTGEVGAPLTVTDDGRVYGHLATWGTCHIGRDDVCLTPPRSAAGYAYYLTGETVAACDDGCDDQTVTVPTGVLTLGTGHAQLTLAHRGAVEHYDSTGTGVADVTAGEDAHGIWIAGAIRPTASPDDIRTLRASSVSGDWRRIGGSLELVAALAVNVPGFPVPRAVAASAAEPVRPRARAVEGRTVALVAAATVAQDGGQVAEPRPLDDEATRMLRRIHSALAPEMAARIRREVHGTDRERADRIRAEVRGR